MANPWEVRAENGIWLPQIGWRLDAARSAPRSFVSHAHSDHIARHREVLCTPATARLMEARLGAGRRRLTTAAFGEAVPVEFGCEATLHPAGHVFGSAQILLRAEQGTLLYTGDFKTRHGLAAEACATPRADVLIMETTFGLPRYVMPPAAETEAAIVAFCREALADGATPVLYAYALGKSQELVALLGGAGLPVMLAPAAFRIARHYLALGCPLPPFAEFDRQRHAGHVVISPPGEALLDWINPKRTAAVTGWAIDGRTKYQYGCDAAFPLSDHADFNELLAFVAAVQPRVVYTVHGFTREFAATLRTRGTEAWALGRGNQLELTLPD